MKRGTTYLFLLLVAASAQKVDENISNGDLKRQLNQIENEHTFDNFRILSVMDRILQRVEANNKKMEDLMMQVQSIKDCQKAIASWSFGDTNMAMFFKTMGRTFYFNTTHLGTWNENHDWCSSRGMQLATLKTAEEVNDVTNTLAPKLSLSDTPFWVSASDIGRSPGQFHWADGTPVLNSTWASGQPDQYKANQETCAFINTDYENLNDWSCSGTCYTLCEVPELLATCF